MKFLLLAMAAFLLVACGEKKWEYRVIQVNSELSKIRSSANITYVGVAPNADINEMADEGWELVTAYPLTESRLSNEGTDTYTKAVQYVFKREVR